MLAPWRPGESAPAERLADESVDVEAGGPPARPAGRMEGGPPTFAVAAGAAARRLPIAVCAWGGPLPAFGAAARPNGRTPVEERPGEERPGETPVGAERPGEERPLTLLRPPRLLLPTEVRCRPAGAAAEGGPVAEATWP